VDWVYFFAVDVETSGSLGPISTAVICRLIVCGSRYD
jgi:hypothetical protein